MSNKRKLRGKDWAPLSRQIRAVAEDREDQFRAEVEAFAPGFSDQFGAATADASRRHAQFRERLNADHPDRYSEADARDLPQQIIDQVFGLYLRVMTEFASGERAGCEHFTLEAPRPAVASAHADWIYCTACALRASRPQLSDREEYTCDLCGSYEPGQTMHAIYPQVGPVMLIVGICPACARKIEQP